MENKSSVLLVLAFLLALPLQGTAQLQCYSDRRCPSEDLVAQDISINECCLDRGGRLISFETAVGEACSECRVYGWKGGTFVRMTEGGELTLSMTVNASQGDRLELAVGYTIGQAEVPRMFTLDFDEDDLQVMTPQDLNLGNADLPVIINVLRDGAMEEIVTVSLVEMNFNQVQGKYFVSTLDIIITADQAPAEVNASLDQAAYMISEEEGSLQICASVSGASGDISATLSAVPGTADASDYSFPNDSSLHFSAIQTTDCITITIVSDGIFESDENFQVMLSAQDGVNIIRSTATVTITDSDAAELQVTLDPGTTVPEIASTLDVSLSLMAASGIAAGIMVPVNLSTVSGTAEAGIDYVPLQERVSVPPDRSEQIMIIDDNEFEGAKSFELHVTAFGEFADRITVVPSERITITIEDNEVPTVDIGLTQTAHTVREADGELEVCAEPTQPETMLTQDLEVTFSVEPGTADSADYQVNSSLDVTLTPIMPLACIRILITMDGIYENAETFAVSLSSTDPGVSIQISEATVEIQNSDNGVIMVNPSSLSVLETSGEQSVCLTVAQIDDKADIDVVIAIGDSSATDDMATEGEDFVVQSDFRAVLNATQPEWCFMFLVLNDTREENSESFNIAISTVQSMVDIVPTDMVTVILEDVPPPTPDQIDIGLTQSVYTVLEDAGQLEVCAEPTQSETVLTRSYEVMLNTEPLTAQGMDFEMISNSTQSLDPGSSFACIIVRIFMDDIIEDTEMFAVTLTTSDPGLNLQISRALVHIVDTTPPPTAPPMQPLIDTISGDPMMTVPINAITTDPNLPPVSLCYEIHGEKDRYFNFISDTCLSVNAHYTSPMLDFPINVINQIAIVATNEQNNDVRISVDLSNCTARVDDVEITRLYFSEGIYVRKYPSRVTISTTNCQDQTVVMRVFCLRGSVSPDGENFHELDMIRLVVGRNVSLTETSHGIVGQFWNIPISVSVFNESTNRYLITVSHPDSPQRQFVGDLYDFNWLAEKMPCFYVGDRQGAKGDGSHGGPNDPVIEGTYKDYRMDGPFDTDYKFSRFGANGRK